MKRLNRWLGAEIVFVQIGHGLIAAAVLGVVAANAPWWARLALTPLVVFSVLGWLPESSLILPVARQLLSGGSQPEVDRARSYSANRPGKNATRERD